MNTFSLPMDYVLYAYSHLPIPTSIHIPHTASTHTHTTYIPSNPTVYFDNTSPVIPSSDPHGLPSHYGRLSSTTPHVPGHYSYDTSFDPTLDPESQTIDAQSEMNSASVQTSFHDNTTTPCENLHPSCQANLDPPSMEVKEQKRRFLYPLLIPRRCHGSILA
jgi:hypothetical protein